MLLHFLQIYNRGRLFQHATRYLQNKYQPSSYTVDREMWVNFFVEVFL